MKNKMHSKILIEKDINPDPLLQFKEWLEEAINKKLNFPDAMHLSTADKFGRPSGRIVLYKGFDVRGFSFFTNYESRKGMQLTENNQAAITFFWSELYRQVRIEGKVFRLSAAESDSYFDSRPAESRVSAIASRQSGIVESREILEAEVKEIEQKIKGQKLRRPAGWGGYYLSPDYFEFWQGREHRLHDRISYTKIKKGNSWKIERLYP
jgi:pyridoxamine 5'-phosphate oxidase